MSPLLLVTFTVCESELLTIALGGDPFKCFHKSIAPLIISQRSLTDKVENIVAVVGATLNTKSVKKDPRPNPATSALASVESPNAVLAATIKKSLTATIFADASYTSMRPDS